MILDDIGIPVYSMKEAGIDIDIVEDGTTFEENAMIKAKAISELLPHDVILADDSGLEIDYPDKAPGIYSARYAGVDTSYDIKNQMLLDQLEHVPDEQAHSAICLCHSGCLSGWDCRDCQRDYRRHHRA